MLKRLTVDPRIRAKHAELIEPPIIVRLSKFNEDGAKEFAEQLDKAHHTGQPVIPVLVDSYGGQVYSLLEMISTLQQATLPVVTVCEGKAMSAGAMLFCMGQKRYMSDHATLMLHDVSSFTFGKVEELKSDAKEADRLNKLIFTMIAKNVGQPEDYFLKIIHEKGHAEWYVPPKDAKKHKLCTHIGVPEFTIEVGVKYRFDGEVF